MFYFLLAIVDSLRRTHDSCGLAPKTLLESAMKKKKYTPRPIDTRAVNLPDDLVALTERLAEHTHDVWAALRLSQGWTYGPTRDDTKKHHPCLIPYSKLPESEKEADRHAALGTLKAILALKYIIAAR